MADPTQQLTPEQLNAILASMQDPAGEQIELQRQQAISNRLRQGLADQPHRMDWASQGARGIGGYTQGMQYNKEQAAAEALRKARQDMASKLPQLLGRGAPQVPQQAPLASGYGVDY